MITADATSPEVPVDFDISDHGIFPHQKLTKTEFGRNGMVATSAGVGDLTPHSGLLDPH